LFPTQYKKTKNKRKTGGLVTGKKLGTAAGCKKKKKKKKNQVLLPSLEKQVTKGTPADFQF
jgi:hypothetical protein